MEILYSYFAILNEIKFFFIHESGLFTNNFLLEKALATV